MKALQLRNHQREHRINAELLREITRALIEEELGLGNYEVAVHLVSSRKMTELNEHFLQHAGSTDVITFDYREGYPEKSGEEVELAGEIYISVADAIEQAREFRTEWPQEVVRYVVHGALHLQGYNDMTPASRRIMKREENRLVRKLARCFPIARIAR